MKFYITALACLGLSLLAAMTPAEVHRKLQTAYNNLSSYQATVSQSNRYRNLSHTIDYSGRIYYSPGRMLMHFTSPQIQRLQIESGNITLYDAQSNTIMRSRMRPEFARMNPIELLQEYWGKSTVRVASENRSFANVELTVSGDPIIRSISARVNRISGLVDRLSYTDASGNSVSYTFSDIRTNASIPASVWRYSYPADAQEISP
ncbi:MAG TPA: outer membrane lipoprotein carrier protein LolA [Candidatus Cloacimonadota bacterium]|nr:outer membrane lipoprotein carrier protein LolA [Candidatus Cloacimonadota bacterium]